MVAEVIQMKRRQSKKKTKKKRKKPQVSQKAMTYDQANARIHSMHDQLSEIFSNYIVVGLRKPPDEEVQADNMTEKMMYYMHGTPELVGGMAALAAENLAQKAIMQQQRNSKEE
jgi:hypothetical protein